MPEGRFTPDHALQLIQDHGVTIWATVPTMVWRVCEFPHRHDYDTSPVKSVAFGGSPSAAGLRRKLPATFPNVPPTPNTHGLPQPTPGATGNPGPPPRPQPPP